MFQVLRPLLNRGGAGRYVSRAETTERLLPLAAQHNRLMLAYDDVLTRLSDGEARARLEAFMPALRLHLGKLHETVYSAGGTPPLGADRAPRPIGDTPGELLHHVLDAERDYHAALISEVDAVHHQERTRAILGHLARGSDERLDALRAATARYPRPTDY